MAKRYTSTFPSEKGTNYTVEIWDSSFSSTATDFTLGAGGFDLRYAAEGGKRTSAVIGSEVTFDMLVTDATEYALITDIHSSAEGRFTVRILKGSNLFWAGTMVYDNTAVEDYDYPYFFTIRAVDGLGLLAKIPYYNAGTLYTGVEHMTGHIINCLNKLSHVPVFYTAGTALLKTSVDWWQNGMTNSASNDPLYLSGVDHIVFYDFHTTGGVDKDVLTCAQVLSDILTAFGARIELIEGTYWVRQISYIGATAYTWRSYDTTASYLTNGTVSGSNNIDHAILFRETGGHWDWLPPLSKVTVKYNVFNRSNIISSLQQIKVNPLGSYVGGTVTRDISSNSGATTIRFSGDLNIQIINNSYSSSSNDPLYIIFKATLRVGSYYYKNTYAFSNFVPTYYPQGWVSSSGFFYFAVPFNNPPAIGSSSAVAYSFNFLTTPLPADGTELEYTLQIDDIVKPSFATGGISYGASFSKYYYVQNQWVEPYDDGTPDTKEDAVWYSATNPTANIIEENYDVRIGNGTSANSAGRLRRWIGAGWGGQISDKWGFGTGTKNKDLGDMLASVILNGQKTPLRRMYTTTFGSLDLSRKYTTDGNTWLLQGGTFKAQTDELEGEWFEYAYGTLGGTITPVKVHFVDNPHIPPMGGGGTSSGGGGNPIQNNGNSGFAVAPSGTSLAPLSYNNSSAPYSAGSISSISVSTALTGSDYAAGDLITIFNPMTSKFDTVTVTAVPSPGATSLSVSGTLANDYPTGAYVFKKPIAYAFSLPSGALGQILRFNGTTWVAFSGTTINDVLTWDGSKWVSQAPASSGVTGSGVNGRVPVWSSTSALTSFTSFLYESGILKALNTDTNTGASYAVADTQTNIRIRNTSATNNNWSGVVSHSAGDAIDAALAFRHTNHAVNEAYAAIYTREAGTWAETLKVSQAGIEANATVKVGSISGVTPTNVVGRDSVSGKLGHLSLGSSLQITSGILSVNGGVLSGLTTGRIPYTTGISTLSDTANLTWDNANQRLSIGSGSPSGFLNILQGALSGTQTFAYFSANVSGSMYSGQLNANNVNSGANSIHQLSVGGGSAGDPVVQFSVSGAITTAAGIDNSDGDKFKITPGASVPGGTANRGLIITNDSTSYVGINKDAPTYPLDVAGVARADVLSNSATTSFTVVVGTGAGTGATATVTNGGGNWMFLAIATGTSPIANGTIATITLPYTFTNIAAPVWIGMNTAAINDISKFRPVTISGSQFQIVANGTLAASTSYQLIIHILG